MLTAVHVTKEKAGGVFIGVSSFYSTTYITCPADPKKTLGIKLPFLVMIIKNLKKYFTFEVQVSICMWICILSAIPERWPVNLWEKSDRRKVSLSFWMYSFLPLPYSWFCHYYYDIISVLVIRVSCQVLKEAVTHPENLINSSKVSKLEDWKSIYLGSYYLISGWLLSVSIPAFLVFQREECLWNHAMVWGPDACVICHKQLMLSWQQTR